MAKKTFRIWISLTALGWAVLPLSAGCAPMLVAAGAAAGYAASRDSVTLDLDGSPERVWEAATEEIRELGKIKREDLKQRRLDGQVEGADVVITLRPLTASTVRVAVRARRNLLPKPEIAQRIAFGIVRRTEKSRLLF